MSIAGESKHRDVRRRWTSPMMMKMMMMMMKTQDSMTSPLLFLVIFCSATWAQPSLYF